MDDNTTQILTVILGGFIGIVASAITNWFNNRARKEERRETYRRENVDLRWQEIKRDVDTIDNYVKAVNLQIKEQFHFLQIQELIQASQNDPNYLNRFKPDDLEQLRTRLAQQREEALARVQEYSKRVREYYAQGMWTIFSMPEHIQNAFFDYEKEVTEISAAIASLQQQRISDDKLNRSAAVLRTTLRDYLTKSREEITATS